MDQELDEKTQKQLLDYRQRLQASAHIYQEAAVRLAEARMWQELYVPRQQKRVAKRRKPRGGPGVGAAVGRWFLKHIFPEEIPNGQAQGTKKVVIDGEIRDPTVNRRSHE